MLPRVYLITFLINVVPFFMPPTRVLFACFRVHDDVPLLLLTIGGALAASAWNARPAIIACGAAVRACYVSSATQASVNLPPMPSDSASLPRSAG
jgi:hypothetical protein